MAIIDNNLTYLLEGRAINDNTNLCDFTLSSQNEAFAAKGITPTTPSDFVPIVKDTVTYIVLAILFNEHDEVLLMQEAKRSCAGQWYLPAGRMEPGENIDEAVKREVLEETGLEMEPTTLVCVECASKGWFRFVLTGNITGGTLKTPAKADSESLQAKWISDLSQMSLRSDDILTLIERAKLFIKSKDNRYPDIMPAVRAHNKLLMRFIVCARQKTTNRLHILLSEKTEHHFPLCEINHNRNLHSTIRKFMVDIFGADVPAHKPHGLLSVEYCGAPMPGHIRNDGLCMTILISFRVPLEEAFPIDKYSWTSISKETGDLLLQRLPRNMVIPLIVIRPDEGHQPYG